MKTLCLGCMELYEGTGNICPFCGYHQDAPPKEAFYMPPRTIIKNRYIIGRAIGSGGFGITYIAYDQRLQRKIAVKEYLPAECATRMEGQKTVSVYQGDKREQFQIGMKKSIEEAKLLAELQQAPGIIQVMDFFEENDTAYIVMEYLQGMTLKEKLKRDGVMRVEEALPIILGVLAALKTAHAKNILHRDIAPDNIYLLNDGGIKLIDFGASRQVSTSYSKSLTVLLKIGYAPVEQYEKHGKQGPWTDVYALAATFYKMITGKRPLPSVDRRIQDQLVPPSKLGVVISQNVENALMNALQINIQDRTQSAEEFERELCSAKPVKRTAATLEKKDLGGWPVWLKMVCVLTVVGVIGIGAYAWTRTAPNVTVNTEDVTIEDGFMRMPSFVNLPQKLAEERAENAGFSFTIGGAEASDNIPKGYVIRQEDENGNEIRPGTKVEVGSVLSVIVSSGNGKSIIPDIRYMDQKNALKLLEQEDLTVVEIKVSDEEWGPEGLVISVQPGVGTEIEQKEKIQIVIASGKQSPSSVSEIPDLTGLTQEEAYIRLKEQGLYLVKERIEHHARIPNGQIMSQTPEAGNDFSGTNTIKVVISSGPQKILLPDMTTWMEEDAVAHLEEIGLIAGTPIRIYDENAPEGEVLSQDKTPGILSEGDTVTLTISMGKAPEDTLPVRKPEKGKATSEVSGSMQPTSVPAETTQTETQPEPVQSDSPKQEEPTDGNGSGNNKLKHVW